MSQPTNDIDSLLRMLDQDGWEDYHAALTALIAERDEMKETIVLLQSRSAGGCDFSSPRRVALL